MECKLINSSPNDINNITGTVLHNRGIKILVNIYI